MLAKTTTSLVRLDAPTPKKAATDFSDPADFMKAITKGGVSCSLQDAGKDYGMIGCALMRPCQMHLNPWLLFKGLNNYHQVEPAPAPKAPWSAAARRRFASRPPP
jgi:hypothetical protein